MLQKLPLALTRRLIAGFVEDWTSIKPDTPCIVILKGEQDFVFKKMTMKAEERVLLLESLNQAYQPYQVGISDVLEIWKYHSYQSRDLPQPMSDIQHISATMKELVGRLKKIEDKIEK